MHDASTLLRIVTSAEAAAHDRVAIAAGIPSRALMQRAGAATAGEIAHRFSARLSQGVLIYAGPGNNGGDAWVVARALAAAGITVRVREPLPPQTDDARAERALALASVQLVDTDDAFRGDGVVVDGLLGTGSSGPPRGPIAASMPAIRGARERGAAVVALDIPTGVDATTGAVFAPVIASHTFTYGTIKRGHLMARAACGRIVVLDIGLEPSADTTQPRAVDSRWVARHLPAIPADAHKGTRRKLAIVGGGSGMSGAAVLTARAAWRSGIGMVKLIVAEDSLPSIREAEPQSLTAAWPSTAKDVEREIVSWADVLAIGPGLGTGTVPRALVERILGQYQGPVVLDADALNTFASDINSLARLVFGRVAVLTPHPVEFARLTGTAVDEVLSRRFDVALPLAKHTGAVVLLKGQPTVVTTRSGERLVSATGTPLLAAAGSGDLLTGMVATLLGQIGDPFVAAASAAWVHGRAAWLVQRGGGRVRGATLDDVLAMLPRAWSLRAGPSRYPVLLELPEIVS
jgi:hydroxyethylthiazole kinase-like uncharacterized protein yjeF